ncbi:ACT domain-containing protein ACR8-like [Dioscorea cayenensis subsp. rotundata]|uniref:ACT domain-containing protein ACR n=1 Tax=Dioscorea cayennensis subsp. rotundata TaxID=55577 RepID=A0AB40AXK4_DIOCR|nr:ACT domain-containing protein ACR8-like [Dioscorea cayenensis subsp. rotundata]
MEWPGSLDEYQKLVTRMNTPRVVIDNKVSPSTTIVKLHSARKHGVLLEAIQALSDLNLSITKAYISSDASWFMDVFHLTDHLSDKLSDDPHLLSLIHHSLLTAATSDHLSHPTSPPPLPNTSLTALELTAGDRPGLLSDLFAVLADLDCSIAAVKTWTFNGCMASLLFIHNVDFDQNPTKLNVIITRLRHVINGDVQPTSTAVSHSDRRLHQLLLPEQPSQSTPLTVSVTIQNLVKRDYSVINIQCRDRPKLLFDVVCVLTDMNYVVFHGTVSTDGDKAHQEFYVRNSDGKIIGTEEEKERVVKNLRAGIERRAEKGLRLEICAEDRHGLLADVTRVLRENGLSITMAEVMRMEEKVVKSVFYVDDVAGCNLVSDKVIEMVKERMGNGSLKVGEVVKKTLGRRKVEEGGGVGLVYLGSFVRRNLYNLGLIRSCS